MWDVVEPVIQAFTHVFHDTCHGFELMWMDVFAQAERITLENVEQQSKTNRNRKKINQLVTFMAKRNKLIASISNLFTFIYYSMKNS